MTIEYSSGDHTLEHSDRFSAASHSQAPQFRPLLVLTTASSSQLIELDDTTELTIGRGAPADLRLADPSLSRRHARLSRDGEAVRVVDLGSRNGTWVGGHRIEEAVVRAGDTIVLGQCTIAVQLASPPEAARFGLASPGCVLNDLTQELARSRSFARPLSLLLVRPLTPRRGSSQELFTRCLRALRTTDRAGLYDRDAVLAVLPETTLEDAQRVAERIVNGDCADAYAVRLTCGVASARERSATFSAAHLVSAAWEAARTATLSRPIAIAGAEPSAAASSGSTSGDMVRCNPAMIDLRRQVERLAPRGITVLLHGETGTGKELFASEIHSRSGRRGPLRVVNCAAIPEQLTESVFFGHVRGAFTGAHRDQSGVFVQAHGGTLFLDEIGELSSTAQSTLLRVLETRRVCPIGGTQERDVDVRIVAATHRDLAAMAEQGSFRLDLYHRLASVTLTIPPLRERRDEIEPLVERFLDSACASGAVKPTVHPDALACLLAYHWPGNVRELRNVVERALALYDDNCIRVSDLPLHLMSCDRSSALPMPAPSTQAPGSSQFEAAHDLREAVRQHEWALIQAALEQSQGNQRRAAALLGLPLRTLERKLHIERQHRSRMT